MTNINKMTRKEFKALPLRHWQEDVGEFDSLIILPQRKMHDSGYRCMDFVGVRKDEAVCRLSGCSDVIHIEGIGGYGFQWLKRYGTVPKQVHPTEWNIDCLPKSGLLRLFSRGHIRVGDALSSFEIYSIPSRAQDKEEMNQ